MDKKPPPKKTSGANGKAKATDRSSSPDAKRLKKAPEIPPAESDDEWLGRLQRALSPKTKLKERFATITFVAPSQLAEMKVNKKLTFFQYLGLTVRGTSDLVQYYGWAVFEEEWVPGADYGEQSCEEAAEKVLLHDGQLKVKAFEGASMIVSLWDIHNEDIWGDINDMFDTMLNDVGPLGGPWTVDRLTTLLKQIVRVVHRKK